MSVASSLKVGLVFGGESPEHSISCVSASSVLSALLDLGHVVTCIGISRSGAWHHVPESVVLSYSLGAQELPSVDDGLDPVTISMSKPNSGFVIAGEFRAIDVLFPVLHGEGGEDGSIQGLCTTSGFDFVGSGVRSSAICMDKIATKSALEPVGINVGSWISIHRDDSADLVWRKMQEMSSPPFFIKPALGGSSLGINKIHGQDDVKDALEQARRVSSRLIAETGMNRPRELEVGILVLDGNPHVSPVGEIVVHPEFEFYDFEAKYRSHGADIVVPASLPSHVAMDIQELALKIFQTLDCAGFARVDFFLDQNGDIVFNEINTIPGFTEISMFAKVWKQAGLSFIDVVEALLVDAINRD